MSFTAHKRRKSSGDDRNSVDLGGPSKRPRVFFTEDQKETLRLAYQQDPYPNQQTIECLANQLGVSPKTIINWFHNHRMRAKQQVPSSGSGTPVKSEDDAMSNHSDSMSVSSDNSYRQGPLSTGGADGGSTSQWMFPSFEPIRRSSTNSEQSDLLANSDHFDSERFRLALNGVPVSTSEKELSLLIENNNLPQKQPSTAAAVTKSKRKSAKPQWSYEGTHLDKSRKSTDNVKGDDRFATDVVSSSDDMADPVVVKGTSETTTEAEEDINSVNTRTSRSTRSPITTTLASDENENVTMETDDSQQQDVTEGQRSLRGRLRNKKPLNCAIEKLQQSVNSKEVDWDDPVSSPSS